MDPAIVINIYLNQDGTAASSSAPHVVVAPGTAGTQPGIDIPPPPSADPLEGSAAVEQIPAPPAAPSDQWVTRPAVPSVPNEPSGQDVPPPPVLDAEPSDGDKDLPPPPNQ